MVVRGSWRCCVVCFEVAMTRRLKKLLWPCQVTLDLDDTRPKMDDIELWLQEHCGHFRDGWYAVYFSSRTDFYFRDQGHAVLFALRWQ